jgi:hypothetical protein
LVTPFIVITTDRSIALFFPFSSGGEFEGEKKLMIFFALFLLCCLVA